MPFMDEPPGATFSSMLVGSYGKLIRSLRAITNRAVNKEPKWRHTGTELTTGYEPEYYGNGNGAGNEHRQNREQVKVE
jgi:hydrogenase small subunit